MPGSGTSTQQQQQQSQTQPWAPAQGLLQGILGQANGMLGNTGLNSAENNALNTLSANAQHANRYTPAIQGYTSSLLGGGGAKDQAGAVNQNYLDYQKATQPLAGNTDYNPYNTPGFRDAIDTLTSDIRNSTNGQFAAAGRDFSGANSMALGRGITQGIAPVIAQQYNQNIQNQQGAAQNLFNAGVTNNGILSGMQQQYLANQGQGATAANSGLDNAGANASLAAEAQRRGIPIQNLGLLADLGVPIAGLGSSSSGTSSVSSTMSPIQQFMGITSGIQNLFGGRR